MKKIVLLFVLICFVAFAFANPWSHRYDTWQAEENPSINTGNTMTFAVEWGEGGWTSTQLGYGTSGDGTGWTWVDIPWVEDGSGSNKRCSTTVTFNSAGTYYYVFKMVKDATDYHNDGNVTWDESDLVLTNVITSNVTVSDLPLPITLASFTAKALKGKVVLAWTTESETENSHFLVYRDGDVIARVDGHGTTSEQHSYTYIDGKVVPGNHEYAISDVSYGGVEEIHESVAVEVAAKVEDVNFALNKAYPNPFNPRTAISYQLPEISQIDLSIFNMDGDQVATLYNGEQLAGQHQLLWDATGMPSGIYLVRLVAGEMMQSMKVVLMK